MSLSLTDLRALVRNLDPLQPLEPNSNLHVALEQGNPDLGTAMRRLKDALDRAEPAEGSTQLLTGWPGTGKTTELRRLQAALQADRETPTEALLIDGEDFIDPYTPLDVADVLRVLAYALDRRARELEGKAPDGADGYIQRLLKFLGTEVKLKEIKAGDQMLELRNNPTFRAQLHETLKTRYQAFLVQAQAAINEAAGRIRKARGIERVVVIFDSLEKIRPALADEAEKVEASLERVFLQHADQLKSPACHLIYTFPLALRYLVTGLGTRYGSEPVVMPMVGVVHEPKEGMAEPPENPIGIDFLYRMALRRLGGKDTVVFGPDASDTLKRLARASGGYPRDMIRLLRNLVQRADAFPVSPEAVEQVIADLAYEYALVYTDDTADLLAAVAKTHRLPQADVDQKRLLARLVQNLLVLAYQNGREWYDIHPLLKRHPPVRKRL